MSPGICGKRVSSVRSRGTPRKLWCRHGPGCDPHRTPAPALSGAPGRDPQNHPAGYELVVNATPLGMEPGDPQRWPAFTRFLDDGRICLSNNAAERALRGIAIGRRAWLFAGSDRGGERAAAMFTLIETAKLNGVDPQAWLADVLRRINDHPAARLAELLPWNWPKPSIGAAA